MHTRFIWSLSKKVAFITDNNKTLKFYVLFRNESYKLTQLYNIVAGKMLKYKLYGFKTKSEISAN